MKNFYKTTTLLLLLTIFLAAEEITKDTTYYPSNNAIATISTYSDYTIIKYESYYINGELKYYVDYSYQNDTLRTEKLYKANGKEFAYGKYIYTDSNYTYNYYSTDGNKLSSSIYSLYGYLLKYETLTPSEKTAWYNLYGYDSLGWLIEEGYYTSDDSLWAVGEWSYDSSTSITTYHYTLYGDSVLYNQYTGDKYNEYYVYYKNSTSMKDSMDVLYNKNIVYRAHYTWNDNGYMISDKYYDKDGNITAIGNYSFDTTKNKTTYTYSYTEDSTVWETVSDYRGLKEKTDIYYADTLYSTTLYNYDSLFYIDSIYYLNSSKNVAATESYEYYYPYDWTKTYLYSTPTNDTITFYEYDKDGSIIRSVDIKSKSNIIPNTALTIKQLSNTIQISGITKNSGHYQIVTVNGKIIKSVNYSNRTNLSIPINNISKGFYILRISQNKGVKSIPFIVK